MLCCHCWIFKNSKCCWSNYCSLWHVKRKKTCWKRCIYLHMEHKKKFPDKFLKEGPKFQTWRKSSVNVKVTALKLWTRQKGRIWPGKNAKKRCRHKFGLTNMFWRHVSSLLRKKQIFTKKECHTTGPPFWKHGSMEARAYLWPFLRAKIWNFSTF